MDAMEEKELSIPIWQRYLLNINEAVQYYHIGENKLRSLINMNPDADYLLYVGNKALIKKKEFERFLSDSSTL